MINGNSPRVNREAFHRESNINNILNDHDSFNSEVTINPRPTRRQRIQLSNSSNEQETVSSTTTDMRSHSEPSTTESRSQEEQRDPGNIKKRMKKL